MHEGKVKVEFKGEIYTVYYVYNPKLVDPYYIDDIMYGDEYSMLSYFSNSEMNAILELIKKEIYMEKKDYTGGKNFIQFLLMPFENLVYTVVITAGFLASWMAFFEYDRESEGIIAGFFTVLFLIYILAQINDFRLKKKGISH